MAETCQLCKGMGAKQTREFGWVKCECYWREKILRLVPKALHDGEMPPPSATPPWPLTTHVFRQGDWEVFRQQAAQSLADYMRETNKHATVLILSLYRLKEIAFNTDTEYKSLSALSWGPQAPGIVILNCDAVPTTWSHVMEEVAAVFLHERQLAGKAVWANNLRNDVVASAKVAGHMVQKLGTPADGAASATPASATVVPIRGGVQALEDERIRKERERIQLEREAAQAKDAS